MAIPFTWKFLNDPRTRNAASAAVPAMLQTAAEIAAWTLRPQPLDAIHFFNECALRDAENVMQRFQSQFARSGGSARKADALTLLIEEIVNNNRDVSLLALRDHLNHLCEIRKVIQDIDDEQISFVNHDGKTKTIKTSGLKDRLSRAKKKYRSR